jgi:hypothetical protein
LQRNARVGNRPNPDAARTGAEYSNAGACAPAGYAIAGFTGAEDTYAVVTIAHNGADSRTRTCHFLISLLKFR